MISMADVYRLGRELIDQEPNRSVQIRRRIDTRIPHPLLSVVALPPIGKPSLGGLGNLRAPKPASNSAWANKDTTEQPFGTTNSGVRTGTAAAAVASAIPSRAPTPVAPIIDSTARMALVHGRQGVTTTSPGSTEDWDVDDG